MPTKIYIDGSCTDVCYIIGNRKPIIRPASDEQLPVTSNCGEYYGLLHALEAARQLNLRDIEVLADSQLLVRQLTQDTRGQYIYKTKAIRLKQLGDLVKMLEESFDSVQYTWIPRKQNPAGIILEERSKRRV